MEFLKGEIIFLMYVALADTNRNVVVNEAPNFPIARIGNKYEIVLDRPIGSDKTQYLPVGV